MKNFIKKIPAWLLYTSGFLMLVSVMLLGLWINNKTLIWDADGLAQHYPILVNFRAMLVSFLNHPSAGLTHWSFDLGLGADQLTNFAYYVIGDPFNYLIVLFAKRQLIFGFEFLVFLRMYISGLSFLLFMKNYPYQKFSKSLGALTYTFSGFILATSLHHPFFILPMIFFPLLCFGIDQIFLKHSFIYLALAIGITFISNFYFAWILGLGTGIYLLIKLATKFKQITITFLQLILKLLAALVLGIALAAVVFVPTILFALQSTRISGDFANGMKLFPLEYYLKLPNTILTNGQDLPFWFSLGISSLAFLGAIYCLIHFKKYLTLNISLLVLIIGALFPWFGATFNAFSTPSNRWSFLGILIFGVTTTIFIEHLVTITQFETKILVITSSLLLLILWISNGFLLKLSRHDFVEYGFLFASIMIILLAKLFNWSNSRLFLLITATFMLNLSGNILGFYSLNSSNSLNAQVTKTQLDTLQNHYYQNTQQKLANDHSFYRSSIAANYLAVENPANFTNMNTNLAINYDTHDLSTYLTLQNGYLGKFASAVDNNQFTKNTPIAQLDYRTDLDNLLAVKYLFVNQESNAIIPPGFTKLPSKPTDQTTIYKNKLALPLIYLQTKTISDQHFNKLDSIQKSRAMLLGAQTNDGLKNSVTQFTKPRQLSYQVKVDSDKQIDTPKKLLDYQTQNKLINNQMAMQIMKKNHDEITNINQANHNKLKSLTTNNLGVPFSYQLNIKNPNLTKNCELYLQLDGITFNTKNNADRQNWLNNQRLLNNQTPTKFDQLNAFKKSIFDQDFGNYTLSVTNQKFTNGFTQYGIDNLSNYRPIDHALINLGYQTESTNRLIVNFTGTKKINFKNAKLLAITIDQNYRQNIRRLQSQSATNLRFGNNKVLANVNAKQTSILTSSIPYSSGWQIQIDGKPQPTLLVNQGFVGAKIKRGTHHIQLTYCTPGLLIGLLLSATAFIICIIILLVNSVNFLMSLKKSKRY